MTIVAPKNAGTSILQILLLASLYFAAGLVVFSTSGSALDHHIVSLVVFLSEGIALAAVLAFGARLWPGIFLGQLLLGLHADLPLSAALGIATINSLEAVLAVALFRHFRLDTSLSTLRDIVALVLLIAFVLQPFSALLGNAVLLISGVLPTSGFVQSAFSWWFGNVLGQLLITPMLLLLYANLSRLTWWGLAMTFLLFFALSYTILFLYPVHSLAVMLSLTLPPVILLAASQNLTYSAVAIAVVSLTASYATGQGVGAFATGDLYADIVNLNFYILAHVLLLLIIGGLFAERRKTEVELQEKNRALERAAKLRERVDSMSRHDLKNPLNVVINVPQVVMASERGLSAATVEQLNLCRSAGYLMLDMINRSLDLYKIEEGTYNLSPESVDLIAVIQRVAEELGSNVEEQAAVFAILYEGRTLESNDRLIAHVEKLLCHTLFSNLLKNAMEASPSELVTIDLRPCPDRSCCEVSITNRGAVPEEIRNDFFKRFVSRNKVGGTGLGTYSARLYAEVQGGSIALDTSVNGQTTLTVKLPA